MCVLRTQSGKSIQGWIEILKCRYRFCQATPLKMFFFTESHFVRARYQHHRTSVQYTFVQRHIISRKQRASETFEPHNMLYILMMDSACLLSVTYKEIGYFFQQNFCSTNGKLGYTVRQLGKIYIHWWPQYPTILPAVKVINQAFAIQIDKVDVIGLHRIANPLLPSVAIRWHRIWSTMVQVMALF